MAVAPAARCDARREAARLRPRARARLARPDADRPLARHPERDDVRLRVRAGSSTSSAAARRRGSSSPRRSRPSAWPATASRPPKLAPLPRAEGGVLPRRLRARSGVLDALGVERQRMLVVVRTPPEVVALPPARRTRSSATCSSASAGDDARPRRRPAADGGAARVDPRARAFPPLFVPDRAVDAQSLIALADRRRLRRRDDEPRGGRARDRRSTRRSGAGWARSTSG